MLFFAIAYAIIFWVVSFKRPYYSMVLIYALTPFQQDVGAGGVRFSLTEIHLLLLSPLLLLRLRERRGNLSLGPLTMPIGLYLILSIASTALYWRGTDAVASIMQMILYIVLTVQIFECMVTTEELRKVPYSLIWTGVVWSLVGFATHFTFLDMSKNAFGSSLAAAFLVAFDEWLSEPDVKRRKLIMFGGTVILLGLIMSLSRGAWLGALSGLCVIAMLRRASKTLMRSLVFAAPIFFLCFNLLPQKQQDYAISVDSSRYNIRARYRSLAKAQADFFEDPVLGVGVGLRKEYDATNVLWTTLAETGILGALAFVWIFVAFYRLAWRTRSQLKVKDPYFSLLSIGTALMTSKLMHGMVDHYWTRGVITLAWGGVGMVLVASRLPAQRAMEARRLEQARKQAQQAVAKRPIAVAPSVTAALAAPRQNAATGEVVTAQG